MDLEALLTAREGPNRTAALVAWIQGLFTPGDAPVLVGGAAVELYTGGAHTTGDLDFVGAVTADVENALESNGFTRQGRHWLHERGQLFVEFPSVALRSGETAAALRVGAVEVLVISPEDPLAERLAAWKHWRSTVDGVNAMLLYRAQRLSLRTRTLSARAAALGAADALDALRRLARKERRQRLTIGEIERWAQSGL